MHRGTLGPFPRDVPPARPPQAAGRWLGFNIQLDSTMAAHGAIEIPARGRRVIAQLNSLMPPYTVWDSVGGAQVNGSYCCDPYNRVILWFNAPGVENLVTSPNAALQYYRLDGSGVYLHLGVPQEFLTTFDRLFLEVMNYTGEYSLAQLQLNVERWSKGQGDQG